MAHIRNGKLLLVTAFLVGGFCGAVLVPAISNDSSAALGLLGFILFGVAAAFAVKVSPRYRSDFQVSDSSARPDGFATIGKELWTKGVLQLKANLVGTILVIAFTLGSFWALSDYSPWRGIRPQQSERQQQTQLQAVEEPQVPTSHLEFRGLHAGQTRAEVEGALKKRDEQASLVCDKPARDGMLCKSHECENLSFSGDGTLYYFYCTLRNDGQKPDEFLYSLRQELAASNHMDAKVTPSNFTNMSDTFTWGTERAVVCPLNQEKDDCPAEVITLSATAKDISMAWVEFNDNAYFSQGMVKKDKDRPKPRVSQDITFMNLQGEQTQDQVNEALQSLQYPPLTCKYDSEKIAIECTTKTREHEFDLTFVHSRLSDFYFKFPPNEHDEYYQSLLKNLGQPTDSRGKTGSELFAWESEEMLPCTPGSEDGKQCPKVMLLLAPPDEDPRGKVAYFYKPLMDTQIIEQVQRTKAAIAAQAR